MVVATPHILVAEDEAALGDVLEEYFTSAGYQVTRAGDGLEAMKALPTAWFDVLLTDIRMPRVDGVGLIRHVRRTHPDMPIVVLSGYMTAENREALTVLGVPDEAVLEKPSPFHVLEDAIRAAMSVVS
ncbi:response regulator [Roseomonas sp. GCM10028921]